MKDISRSTIASALLAFLMLVSLGYCAPAWNHPAASSSRLQQKQAHADAEVKAVADEYAHMSDAELVRGDAEAYR